MLYNSGIYKGTLFSNAVLCLPMKSSLPCHSGKDTFGILSHQKFPCLVEQQEAHSESKWQEPVLDWYYCSAKNAVELGHIQEENGNDHREDDGR